MARKASKKDFILRKDMASKSAQEVVDAAEKSGLKMTTAYVYTIRSGAGIKKERTNGAPKTKKVVLPAKRRVQVPAVTPVARLMEAADEFGLQRSYDLIGRVIDIRKNAQVEVEELVRSI